MTLTTSEAAQRLGIAPETVRRWVMKGWLTPTEPRTKPLRFDELHVERVRADRMTTRQHNRLDTLRDQWLAS